MRAGAYLLVAVVLLSAPASGTAAAEPATQAIVEVRRDGESFIVDGLLLAPVSRHEAWTVLTDFDHMGRFVPNLSESRVLRRAGNRLTVFQRGAARFGPLSFPFESVREVELDAEETVRSRNVGGNLLKLESLTRFSDADGATRISYQVEVVPGFWFPGFIGEVLIRSEIEEQFDAVVKEMLRRRAGTPRR